MQSLTACASTGARRSCRGRWTSWTFRRSTSRTSCGTVRAAPSRDRPLPSIIFVKTRWIPAISNSNGIVLSLSLYLSLSLCPSLSLILCIPIYVCITCIINKLYIYIYMYMYTIYYIYTYTHIIIYVYTHSYKHVCVCSYVHT